jgi:pyruvate dehydrogenase E1 component beta subunit
MRTALYAAAIREAIRELAAASPEMVLFRAGRENDPLLPTGQFSARYAAPGCAGVATAALGLALGGRPTLVSLGPPAAALAALAPLSAALTATGGSRATGPALPAPLVLRVPLDGGAAPLGRFAGLGPFRVVAPATAADAAVLLHAAFAAPGATLYLEERRLYPRRERLLPAAPEVRTPIVRRAGSDVTLVAFSAMLIAALGAARLLSGQGISAEVIDGRTLAPFDAPVVARSLWRTHRALVIEEGETLLAPSLAAAITEAAFDELDAPVGVVRVPAGGGTLAETLARAVPVIVTRVCWMLGRSSGLASAGAEDRQ